MSVALRPTAGLIASVALTSMAAVAAVRALDALCNKRAMIKWVNDIYIGDKKVCGILTEAVSELESGDAHSIVIGLGLNVHGRARATQSLPPSLAQSTKPARSSAARSRRASQRNYLRSVMTCLISRI